MTDVKLVAKTYIDLWNERTPQRRRELLATNWTSDARYVDPLMSGDGHDGVDALIAGVQQKFPDFQLHADRRAQRVWRPPPFLLGARAQGRRQPDQGHGLCGAEGRPHPQHHRISGSGAGKRLTEQTARLLSSSRAIGFMRPIWPLWRQRAPLRSSSRTASGNRSAARQRRSRAVGNPDRRRTLFAALR